MTKKIVPAIKRSTANKTVKKYSKGGFGILSHLPGSDLPPPSQAFNAYEIVLVKWNINRIYDPPHIWVDGANSGVFSYGDLNTDSNDYLHNIDKFAKAVSNGSLTLARSRGLYPAPAAPNNIMNPFDFVIWRNCYAVFALQGSNWRFKRYGRAVTTVDDQQPPFKYVDLNHVVSNNSPPDPDIGGSTVCKVAYFSAYGNPSGVCTTDYTNMFFEYVPSNSPSQNYVDYPFDPAIKNDGHGGTGVPLPLRKRAAR
jgi:hypothetical protein